MYLWARRTDLTYGRMQPAAASRIGCIESDYPESDVLSVLKLLPDASAEQSAHGIPGLWHKEKSVYRISDTRLVGFFGIGLDRDKRVIRNMLAGNDHYSKLFLEETLGFAPKHLLGSAPPLQYFFEKKANITLDAACVLFSKWRNYYHWNVEHLLKLQSVELFEEKTGIRPVLLIPPYSPSYVYDSIASLGFGDYETLEWMYGSADVKHLVVPTHMEFTRETDRWLKSRIKNSGIFRFPAEKPGEGKRIYISRRDAKVRRVLNEDELEPLIKEYGFEIHVLSGMSFADQVQLFIDAGVVLAPHGAGLTNIIWSDHLQVIEIFGEGVRAHYAAVSFICGHDYHGVMAVPAGANEDMTADLAEIEKAFAKTGVTKTGERLVVS